MCGKGNYEGLKTRRGQGAGYHMQRLLRLADRYGADVVCGAMAHAARYGNYSAHAVTRVIGGRGLPRPQPQRDTDHRRLAPSSGCSGLTSNNVT